MAGLSRIVLFGLTVSFLLWGSGRPQSAEATHTVTGSKALLGVLLSHPNRGAALLSAQTSWEKDVFPSEFAQKNLLLPRPITDKTWFILGFDHASDFNDGTVLRTKDGGVNWSTVDKPTTNHWWQDFASDAYGRLWGVTLDVTTNSVDSTTKIWYSDNGGDNWTESYSQTATSPNALRIYRLVTHPDDPLTIAVYGRYNNSQQQSAQSDLHDKWWAGEQLDHEHKPECLAKHRSRSRDRYSHDSFSTTGRRGRNLKYPFQVNYHNVRRLRCDLDVT